MAGIVDPGRAHSLHRLARLPVFLAPAAAASDLADDGAPWHDQTLPLGARMKLAGGCPVRRRMMAAMGQQDCGQCGYNCGLCQCHRGAGGRPPEPLRARRPVEEMGGGATDPDEAKAKADAKTAAKALDADIRPGRSRNAPAEAVFAGRKRLNREGSEKATYHVEFDISDAGLDYEPGDSFGIFPENDESLVDQVIAAIGEGEVPPWSGLAEAWRLERLDGAARRFLLAGGSASADFDASPTICACFGVKSRAILAAIADGACSTEAVGARLNAGTSCGSCLLELKRMIAARTQEKI